MIRLAASVGCPSGIGPEVSVAGASTLLEEEPRTRVVLVGDHGALVKAARTTGVDPARLVRVASAADAFALPRRRGAAPALPVLEPAPALLARERRPGVPSRAGGAAQLAWVDAATDMVARGEADALVTGPVSKDAIARSGVKGANRFLGHTEHLARRLGAPEVTMAFHAHERALTTSLVTTHLPLAKVPRAVTVDGVARAAFWTAWLVGHVAPAARGRRRGRPRLAIAALNPHAGENGLLGSEEVDVIAPGIEAARRRLARARIEVELDGPVPAETAFRRAADRAYDGVVAMYHDQATIPMKILGFGEAVNLSLGLPIIRTSVDHGTAYDRAGKGSASPLGMLEALRLAAFLVSRGAADDARALSVGRGAGTRATRPRSRT